ncbi:uncharacterized protein LOC132551677 [Ylistrum balloti]|uniref:uncharacterized protein LOC132551677 n=1 Tax=Ylistrum balloti TaxID=509963 RepID=UPI002905ACAD|nr:uncharacterized protein LOC132551677 [Ylistrum balloti]
MTGKDKTVTVPTNYQPGRTRAAAAREEVTQRPHQTRVQQKPPQKAKQQQQEGEQVPPPPQQQQQEGEQVPPPPQQQQQEGEQVPPPPQQQQQEGEQVPPPPQQQQQEGEQVPPPPQQQQQEGEQVPPLPQQQQEGEQVPPPPQQQQQEGEQEPPQQQQQQLEDTEDLPLPPPPPPVEDHLLIPQMATGGINLKKYNGTDSPVIWLTNLESWQKFHNVPNERTLAAMSFNMEGPAALWLQGLPDTERTDFVKFKESFLHRFGQKTTDNKFFSLKQSSEEPAEKYLERAEKLALGHTIVESYKVQVAMNGLQPKLKSKVLGKEPKTFLDLRHAVDLAKEEIACTTDTDSVNMLSMTKLCDELVNKLQTQLVNQIQEVREEVSVIASKQHHNKTNYKQPSSQHQLQQPPTQPYVQQHQQPFSPHQAYQVQQPFSQQQAYQYQQPFPPQQAFQPQQPSPPQWYQPQQQQQSFQPQLPPQPQNRRPCQGCGKSCLGRFLCPAYNTQCSFCKIWHHTADVCRRKKFNQPPSTNMSIHNSTSPAQNFNRQ